MVSETVDAVIVGAGPAGLSAALVLGRCRRRVLACDTGRPRNAMSRALHGFLSREGIDPAELRSISRAQLRPYQSVELRDVEVTDVVRATNGFTVTLGDGQQVASRKVLLASGVRDELPELRGFDAFYGRSIFHCPYCDAWEVRDEPLAVYGNGDEAVALALGLTGWSGDVVLCTDGPAALGGHERQRLTCHGIGVREDRILGLEGRDGILERIVFVQGEALPRRAMFFSEGRRQRSNLAERLGCEFTAHGTVETGDYASTNVPGLFVAGDASRLVQLAIVAASEGAQAGFAMNRAMLKEDLEARERLSDGRTLKSAADNG